MEEVVDEVEALLFLRFVERWNRLGGGMPSISLDTAALVVFPGLDWRRERFSAEGERSKFGSDDEDPGRTFCASEAPPPPPAAPANSPVEPLLGLETAEAPGNRGKPREATGSFPVETRDETKASSSGNR